MPDLYSEGYIYYAKTHRPPDSTFQYTFRSNLDLFTFDAAENMELFLVKDAHHIQTYFVPEYVAQIENKLVEFYGKNL